MVDRSKDSLFSGLLIKHRSMSQQSALNFFSWPIYTPKDYLLTSTMKDKKPTSSIPPFQSLLFIVFNSFIIYPK